jgi:4-alpha-glucanotransferase
MPAAGMLKPVADPHVVAQYIQSLLRRLAQMKLPRSSGVLLHVTSLPGPFGIGDLGPEAFAFVDRLADAGQSVWQVLPIVPVGYGYSPYASPSTFAGNPLLVSPEVVLGQGLLRAEEVDTGQSFPDDTVDFATVIPFKEDLLRKAYVRFRTGGFPELERQFESFRERNGFWLHDYSLFDALKTAYGGVQWTEWPAELVRRSPEALERERHRLEDDIVMRQFWQYLFFEQWSQLHQHCTRKGVRIMGDLPIYVAHDSADVWSNPELFELDDHGRPLVVAGVPPDYFSETGQRWGNPIYRWERMRETAFEWWTRRFRAILDQVDIVRNDHFRRFEAFWEIPESEPTAVVGRWVKGPGSDLFKTLQHRLGSLPLVAEDLGVITEGVVRLKEEFGLPGMAILQFAFDSDPSAGFLPHNYARDVVAYTGTHDNDTVVGWYYNATSTQDARVEQRARAYCREYLGFDELNEDGLHWRFITALQASVAALVVFPVQDLLGLSSDARMNTPGQVWNNWIWRLRAGDLTEEVLLRLRNLTRVYGRLVD